MYIVVFQIHGFMATHQQYGIPNSCRLGYPYTIYYSKFIRSWLPMNMVFQIHAVLATHIQYNIPNSNLHGYPYTIQYFKFLPTSGPIYNIVFYVNVGSFAFLMAYFFFCCCCRNPHVEYI